MQSTLLYTSGTAFITKRSSCFSSIYRQRRHERHKHQRHKHQTNKLLHRSTFLSETAKSYHSFSFHLLSSQGNLLLCVGRIIGNFSFFSAILAVYNHLYSTVNCQSAQKSASTFMKALHGIRRRPMLPGRVQPSTFGTERLNFCVRDGNRCDPLVIATGNCELVEFPVPSAFADPSGNQGDTP